jgi:hypothetical protein
MNYYKLIQYAEGDNYETKEMIINQETFEQYRNAIGEGKEFLVLKDMVIRVSSIKEISPANDIVGEYQRQGLKIDGLLEPAEKPRQITGQTRKVGDYPKETREVFYKKMGWEKK